MTDTHHRCRDGDCVASLALSHGLTADRVWKHGDNAALRERDHAEPELCTRGDDVTIPAVRERTEQGGTEARHTFRRLGPPLVLRVRFLDEGEPRANATYRLRVDGQLREGTLDGQGVMEEPIGPAATEATVELEDEHGDDAYRLRIGALDPIAERRGQLQRLRDLGFDVEPDDPARDRLPGVVAEFQQDQGLEATGELDDATVDALREAFGC